ncbi:double-stranded RNA-binding protein 4-like [Telopea speciosissima]|uniref:double-stranded RNA-binding protein 4-like n=1 Tax=Telopea speciosissima TaxID=54955 RepID=UPI001CC814FF|nr:double-stranded RNA-binding protein 4-like [Telopea speciosissima]
MAAAVATPTTSKPSVPEHVSHKNRLQEYTQRSAIPLPIYQTINEGSPHAPMFRSTVLVDGAAYVSVKTFSQRKEAEQAVAKHALERILEKIKNEGCPLIVEDTIFCKSILNEYAVKMSLEKPSYKTTQSEGLLPLFFSSLSFNGKLYTGSAGKNKKEAEQLAARTVIQSILVESNSGTCLSEIIKSKGKLYAAMHKIKDSGASMSQQREVGVPLGTNILPAYSGTCQRQLDIVPVILSHVHELKKPKQEPFSEASTSFTGAFEPVPHVHQPLPNQVRNEVPLAQPSAVNVRGSSQGTVVVQNEVPLAQPSAVNVRGSSQGTVVVQNEVPLAQPSAVNVRGSSQGIVVQSEVPLTQPSAVGGSSEGTVVTAVGVKRSRKKNRRSGKKRFRNDESQFAMHAINQTASCSVAQ